MSETKLALQKASAGMVAKQFTKAPTAYQNRSVLTPVAGTRVDEWTRLISVSDCRKIVSELEGILIPANLETAARQAEVLIGSYPERKMADENIFVRAVTSIFNETPPDIGFYAVDELTRSCKWLPSRSEVVDVCSNMLNERKAALRIATDHLEEHMKRGKEKDTAVRYADLTEQQKSDFDKTISSSIRSMS